MPYDRDGNWYEDPHEAPYDGPLSPYEQAVERGGQEAGDALLEAANEYYTNYPDGHDDGREVNWLDPQSYQWLINEPQGTNPTGGSENGPGGYRGYAGPMRPNYGFYTPAPEFNFDYEDFAYDPFQAPDPNGIFSDPSYQFRMDQGRKALEQSAAGKGVLRTGGTLKDILAYGQNMASQEYGNIFDRAHRTYDTNRRNAFENFTTNHTNRYTIARDRYAPTLLDWQTRMSMGQRAADLEFERMYDAWKYGNPSASDILNAGSD
jgi:hypothetical protein